MMCNSSFSVSGAEYYSIKVIKLLFVSPQIRSFFTSPLLPLPIGIPTSPPPHPRRPHVTAVPSFHFPGFSPHLSSSRIYLFLLSQIKVDPSPKKTPSIAINIGGRSLSNGGLPSTRLLRLDPPHRSPFCLFWPSTSNHLNGDRGNAKNTKV